MVNIDEFWLYKDKKRALNVLHEEHGECFRIMKTYANMILMTNPSSRVVISTKEPIMIFN